MFYKLNLRNNRNTADLKLLSGEFDCSFRGTINNYAYFSTIRGKVVKIYVCHIYHGL